MQLGFSNNKKKYEEEEIFLDRWAFADMKNLKHVFNFFFIHHLIFII